MDKEMLKRVQNAQLEIANEIKRVCVKRNINYFMDSGSLLGAVRHKGFIPWDDDMDFGMIIDEYEKFVSIVEEELGEGFAFQSWDTDEGYPFAFGKVLKLGTEFVEDVFEDADKRNELYVDVFPYYPFPSDVSVQKKQKRGIQMYKHILMVQSGMKPWTRPSSFMDKAKVRIMYFPFVVMSKFISRDKAKRKYLEILNLSRNKDFEGFFPAGTSKFGKWVIPAKCFSSYTQLQFEDTEFMAPADYDLYLRSAYGDYMTPPPEDQRENRHKIIRIKL